MVHGLVLQVYAVVKIGVMTGIEMLHFKGLNRYDANFIEE